MVAAGDRQWKDAGFCHSCHRTASEKRREAEEDAGGNHANVTNLGLTRLNGDFALLYLSYVGWCPGNHAHSRTGPSDQRGDAVLPREIPTVHVRIV